MAIPNIPVDLTIRNIKGFKQAFDGGFNASNITAFDQAGSSLFRTLNKIGRASDKSQRSVESFNNVLRLFQRTIGGQNSTVRGIEQLSRLQQIFEDLARGKGTAEQISAVSKELSQLRASLRTQDAKKDFDRLIGSEAAKAVKETERVLKQANRTRQQNVQTTQRAVVKSVNAEIKALEKLVAVRQKLGQDAGDLQRRIRSAGGRRTSTSNILTEGDDQRLSQAQTNLDKRLKDSQRNLSVLRKEQKAAASEEQSALERSETARRQLIQTINRQISAQKKVLTLAKAEGSQAGIGTAQQNIVSLQNEAAQVQAARGILSREEAEGINRTIQARTQEALVLEQTTEKTKQFNRAKAESIKRAKNFQAAIDRDKISVDNFANSLALAVRRYSAFLLGTSTLFIFISGFREAARAAFEFEASLTKIQQVIGSQGDSEGIAQIGENIRKAAVSIGVSADEIAQGVLTFAQAGFKDVEQLAAVTEELAKIPLSATFDDIASTSEGLLAVFGQFNKDLEDTAEILDLVNQFAADFATTSADIFEGVKRGGAAFSAAGGDLEEFIALFSVLRESTRESASTLGTFFKSGLARLLRPQAQGLIRQLGVTATDPLGQLTELAPIIANEDGRLSEIEVIDISRRLVGQRQFNRLKSLLKAVDDPDTQARIERSLASSTGSLDRATLERLDDLGVSLDRIREAFLDLGKSILENDAFKRLAQDAADLTQSLLALSNNIAPLLPILGLVGAAGLGRRFVQPLAISSLQRFAGVNRSFAGLSSGARVDAANRGIPSLRSTDSVVVREALRTQRAEARAARRSSVAGFRGFFGSGLSGGPSRFSRLSNIALPLLAAGFVQGNTGGRGNSLLGGAVAGGLSGGLTAGVLSGGNPLITALGAATGAILGLTKELNEQRRNQFQRDITSAQFRGPDAVIGAVLGGQFPVNRLNANFGTNAFRRDIRPPTSVQEAARRERNRLSDARIQATDIAGRLSTGDRGGAFLQSALNEILDDTVQGFQSKILEDLRSGGALPDANEATTQLRELFTEALQELPEFAGLTSEGLAKIVRAFEEVNGPIGVAVENLEKLEEQADVFRDRLAGQRLRQSLIGLGNALLAIERSVSVNADSLNAITTDLGGTPELQVSSLDSELIRRAGFDAIAALDTQTREFAGALTDFLGSGEVREGLQEFLNSAQAKDSRFIETAESLFQDFGLDRFAGTFIEQIIDTLVQESGQTIDQVIGSLVDSTNIEEAVRELRPGFDTFEQLASVIREQTALFNTRIQLESELSQSIIATSQAISDLDNQVTSLRDSIQDRRLARSEFLSGGSNPLTSARQRAAILQGRAGRSAFGDTRAGIIDTIAAARQRVGALQNFEQVNRRGFNVFDSSDRAAAREAVQAQTEFLRLQGEINNRIAELGDRIQQATQATDILRQAFVQFDSGIQAAGASVSALTQQDFANGLDALRRFSAAAQLSGTNSFGQNIAGAGRGLEAINGQQFQALQQILDLVGDIGLGSGLTGSDISANINRALGVPALGAILSATTPGLSQDQAERQIIQELDRLKQEAEAAAALEERLREEQILLLETQKDLLEIEKQFFQDQLNALDTLTQAIVNNPTFEAIRSKIEGLFTTAQPVIFAQSQDAVATPQTGPTAGINPSRASAIIRQAEDQRNQLLGPSVEEGLGIDTVTTAVEDVNTTLQAQQDALSNLSELGNAVGALNSINDSVGVIRGILERINEEGASTNVNVQIAPLQVNVAISVPDILKVAGPTLKRDIMDAIGLKLGEVFSSSPETASRIEESFQGE